MGLLAINIERSMGYYSEEVCLKNNMPVNLFLAWKESIITLPVECKQNVINS